MFQSGGVTVLELDVDKAEELEEEEGRKDEATEGCQGDMAEGCTDELERGAANLKTPRWKSSALPKSWLPKRDRSTFLVCCEALGAPLVTSPLSAGVPTVTPVSWRGRRVRCCSAVS